MFIAVLQTCSLIAVTLYMFTYWNLKYITVFKTWLYVYFLPTVDLWLERCQSWGKDKCETGVGSWSRCDCIRSCQGKYKDCPESLTNYGVVRKQRIHSWKRWLCLACFKWSFFFSKQKIQVFWHFRKCLCCCCGRNPTCYKCNTDNSFCVSDNVGIHIST